MKEFKNQIASEMEQLQPGNDGFVSLAQLGIALSKQGITAETLGVQRLAHYFQNHPDYELSSMNNMVRLRPMCVVGRHRPEASQQLPTALCEVQIPWSTILPEIADMVRSEDWSIGGEGEYALLQKYIKTQYSAAINEKLVLHNGHCIIFHSALYNHILQPLYVVLMMGDDGLWHWSDIKSAGQLVRTAVVEFGHNHLPSRPSYGKPEDRFFDVSKFSDDSIFFEHILRRIGNRAPKDFLLAFCPQSIRPEDIDPSSAEFAEKYYQALLQHQDCYFAIVDRLRGIISRSLAMVEENQVEAVPMYNFKRHTISHVLPLKLSASSEQTDLALLVVKESNQLIAPTILTLEQARIAARTLGRINNSWLH